jgi:hypothetical protein
VITCHDVGCWLALMGFQLIDYHLAISVPALARQHRFNDGLGSAIGSLSITQSRSAKEERHSTATFGLSGARPEDAQIVRFMQTKTRRGLLLTYC